MASKRRTQDELAEDWWEQDPEDEGGEDSPAPPVAKKKKEKDSMQEVIKHQAGAKKKTRKKKPVESKLQKEKLLTFEELHAVSHQCQLLTSALDKHYQKTLTQSENDPIQLQESWFVDSSQFSLSASEQSSQHLAPFLMKAYPKWDRHLSKLASKGSPLVLILGSSALRMQDLNRALRPALGHCVVAKLFAKHIKISEQETFLQSKAVGCAVGTPNRVAKLVTSGHLDLSCLRLVILDWFWRDQKQRRIEDISEVWQDMAEFLRTFLIPTLGECRTKVALF